MKSNRFPLVTVYITNYNYANYLEGAIQSILNQTFQDFELIIIDDGSTDCSSEIIKRYEDRPNIFIIFQKNKGLNKTNNVALKLARGEYIMRLDADDYLDLRALEIMINELKRNPEVCMIFPDYYLIDEEDKIIDQVRRHHFKKNVSLYDQPAHGACTMFRREVLLKLGGYDEDFTCQDCYDIWLKIIPDHQISNINLPLFYYRQHQNSLTKNERALLSTRAAIKAKHVEKRQMAPTSVLAIVPVRGRTMDPRSLPLAKLGEKRLIDWSLEAALVNRSVKDIMVSTPNREVQKYVRNNYAERVLVAERSKDMARINISIEQTLLETLGRYTEDHAPPDLLLVLFIEAPFRSSLYIDKAIHTLQLYDVDVVDGIREEDDIFYFHNGNGLQPWNLNSGLRLERESLFRRAGGLHLMKRDFFEREQSMLSGRIGHIFLDQKAAFTIKTEMDWKMAEFLATQEI